VKEIEAAGQLVVISYDSAEVLKSVAAKRGISLLLLSDPGSKTIEAYGILNKEATGRAKGVCYPGVFILDQQGVVRSKLFFDDYKLLSSSADVIRALNEVH
jgi:peroxiredoxin